MLTYVECKGKSVNRFTNRAEYTYIIRDTQFTQETTVHISYRANVASTRGWDCSVESILAIIQTYQDKLVAKNVAAWYTILTNHFLIPFHQSYIEEYRIWLDRFVPQIEYSKKYYPCVLNKLQRFKFANQFQYATSTS